ncbi:hypothetical protein SAMN04487777_101101 [Priestia aryabhattai B8W22]|nr:hypothetical protein SAMN04487777_101101 [Priestia aryabhattai B8W22]
MFFVIIGFIAVFIILCSLEAKLRTIVKQNNGLIKLLEKRTDTNRKSSDSIFGCFFAV